MNTSWLLLILSLPTHNATVRQRAWRGLKASGAAVLRDGVYLLPDTPTCGATLAEIASQVRESGGTARVLRVQDDASEPFVALFDRSAAYLSLQEVLNAALTDATHGLRTLRRLRKEFEAVAATDYFPGAARQRTENLLREMERRAARADSPDEPDDSPNGIRRRRREEFQQRLWATRRRPWVDRLASAWLIRRFIDSDARFLWLASPEECPADAVGFDFDGATFTHAADRVTFEVLLESFALDDAALARLGRVVHHLDVGGTEPPEAAGIEALLAGLRETAAGDDALLDGASGVFDALVASYRHEKRSP
jgi:hypothetical protein